MASSKSRQRMLARDKAKRQTARRVKAAVRRRQLKAGGLAFAIFAAIGLVGAWRGGAFEPDPKAPVVCAWTPNTNDTNPDLRDVGTPRTRGIAKSGTRTMTIALGQGTVEVEMDLSKVPCSAESLAYLAGKKFFDNSTCHRLVNAAFFALQCGDPKGSGLGGPTYTSVDENLPVNGTPAATPSASGSTNASRAASAPASVAPPASTAASANPSTSATPAANTYTYQRGVVAFSNNGPNTNGSQFYIFFKDSPAVPSTFSIIGTVTKGIEVVEGIGTVGVADKDGKPQTDGAPKEPVQVKSLTVGPVRKNTKAAPPSAQPSTG